MKTEGGSRHPLDRWTHYIGILTVYLLVSEVGMFPVEVQGVVGLSALCGHRGDRCRD